MGLSDDLSRIAAIAREHADAGEEVGAILVAEATPDERTYVSAFTSAVGRMWLAFDDDGAPVTDRRRIRDAVSIAAMCEVAEERAGMTESTETRVATPSYLDAIGETMNEQGDSGLAVAVQGATGAVEELAREVLSHYKLPLT